MKIGVITRVPGYTVRRLKEEATLRGHEAVTIKYPECFVEIQRDQPDVHYRGELLNDIDAIIPRILPGMTNY